MKRVNQQFSLLIHGPLAFDLLSAGSDEVLATGCAVLSTDARHLPGLQPDRSSSAGPAKAMTDLGEAERLVVATTFSGDLRITLSAEAYLQWPNAFVLQWTVENTGQAPLPIDRFTAP